MARQNESFVVVLLAAYESFVVVLLAASICDQPSFLYFWGIFQLKIAFRFSKLSSFSVMALFFAHVRYKNPIVCFVFGFYVFLINVFQKLTFDAFTTTLMLTKS